MAQTPFFAKEKWAGYLSGYRILPSLVALAIMPFGGKWDIPLPWDGEVSLPAVLAVTALIVAMLLGALFLGRWEIRVGRAEFSSGRLFFVLAGLSALLLIPFNGDEWHIGLGGDWHLNAYMLLFVLTLLAPVTDVLDGYFADKFPRQRQEDFFIWNTGKEENDKPNAFFFILVPAALTIRFFLEQLFNWDAPRNPDYMFWIVLVLSGVLLGGTIVFDRVKATAVPEQALIAEVMQGWLAGLYYFLIPLAFAVLAFAHWSWVWQTVVYSLYTIGSAFVFLLTQDRWFDRPESIYTGTQRY